MSLWGRCYYSLCRTRAGHAAARQFVALMRRLGWPRSFHMPLDALELEHRPLATLMVLWSHAHWSSGEGMMPPEQLLAVYRLAAGWPAEGDIVELGSWVGLTTSYLATACRSRGEGRVYAVDTFEGTKEGEAQYQSVERHGGNTLEAFASQIERAQVEDLIEPLVGHTTEMVQAYDGGPIRLLLIDADHSYEGVRRDFADWSPLVAPGGLIIFHDYLMPEAGVRLFVDQEVSQDKRFDMTPGHIVPNVMAVTRKADPPAPKVRPSVRSLKAKPTEVATVKAVT